MATDYAKMAMEMQWENLDELWTRIVDESPMPEWVAGRAFEHLVLRMFQLDGAEVTWPFSVKLYEEEVEQIDGAVYWNGMACLVECKDQDALIAFEPVAKLRNQLLRRPAGVTGLFFSTSGFTEPAKLLANFTAPQAILLWDDRDVREALAKRSPTRMLSNKYREFVEQGVASKVRQAP